jgi:hypothetical protein
MDDITTTKTATSNVGITETPPIITTTTVELTPLERYNAICLAIEELKGTPNVRYRTKKMRKLRGEMMFAAKALSRKSTKSNEEARKLTSRFEFVTTNSKYSMAKERLEVKDTTIYAQLRDSTPSVRFINEQFIRPDGMGNGNQILFGSKSKRSLGDDASPSKQSNAATSIIFTNTEVETLVDKSSNGAKSVKIGSGGKVTLIDNSIGTAVPVLNQKRVYSRSSSKRTFCTLLNFMFCITSCFRGTTASLNQTLALLDMPTTKQQSMQRIRETFILPCIIDLELESKKAACADYRRQYKSIHPHHKGFIPVMLSCDGRWQKRWGWNSLDGHVISYIHPLPVDKNKIKLKRNCVGVYVYHRVTPSVEQTWETVTTGGIERRVAPTGEENKWFQKSAGAMDPQGIYDTVKFLLSEGIEVVTFLHDNDAKGFQACVRAKKHYMNDNPNSGISDTVRELLCARHGASHAGKYMMTLAREELPVGLKKVNGRDYCWLASDKCRRYFTKMFRFIVKRAKTAEEAKTEMDGFRKHLEGNHENNPFCTAYGSCLEADYNTTRPDIKNAEKLKILDKWFIKWGNIDILKKYVGCYDTNLEESSNFLMIMFMEKRLFSRVKYEIAARSVALFRNEKGWNFLIKILEYYGVDVTTQFRQRVNQWENQAMGNMITKNTVKGKEQNRVNHRLRRQQNKNSKQTTHIILDIHRITTNIHGIATNKRRRKQSTCSCCGALGHRKNSKSCPNHPANSN